MGKPDKNICYKRRVILLKYKDKRESLILSKTVERRKEKLSIKVQFNTKIRKSHNRHKLKEKYPVFKAQLKDRSVPRCLRGMCAKKNKYIRIPQQHKQKPREPGQDMKHQIKRKRGMSLSSISSIEISDELNNSFEYDNISSGSLGSYTDDEIETLMKSTRKRMKDLDDDWTLFPRQHPSSPVSNRCDNSDSINSLDTLVLEADDSKEYLDMYDLKNEVYSPTISPEESKYESFITHNNKNFMLEFKDTENLYENHVQSDNKIDDKVLKKQENSNFEYNYKPCYSAVNVNNNSIKQELYGDL
ncbi:uncharacterized protein LOC125071030 [Vanessa atalanta]|uniref:uncharacterized protein LOC125071030 n=1 Tax=Vanessa atalanta TaxID=42275 RepID=UPI001FCDEA3F|nr:uncharacterized protein LOC125071030 [Vanessa atalanta]